MGSIGTPEILLILVIALLLFGPKRLPELGKSVGRAIREFKKASQELQDTIEREVDDLKRTGDAPPPGATTPRGALPPPSRPMPPPLPDEIPPQAGAHEPAPGQDAPPAPGPDSVEPPTPYEELPAAPPGKVP